VWAIGVDKYPMGIISIVSVAADVRAFIDDRDRVSSIGQFTCGYRARESSANYKNPAIHIYEYGKHDL
jgi:hypothetical protein